MLRLIITILATNGALRLGLLGLSAETLQALGGLEQTVPPILAGLIGTVDYFRRKRRDLTKAEFRIALGVAGSGFVFADHGYIIAIHFWQQGNLDFIFGAGIFEGTANVVLVNVALLAAVLVMKAFFPLMVGMFVGQRAAKSFLSRLKGDE